VSQKGSPHVGIQKGLVVVKVTVKRKRRKVRRRSKKKVDIDDEKQGGGCLTGARVLGLIGRKRSFLSEERRERSVK